MKHRPLPLPQPPLSSPQGVVRQPGGRETVPGAGPSAGGPQPITILLVDDHTMIREGLRMMLGLEPDLEVVGEAENGRRAIALAIQLQPAVVVMDIAMPGLNGLEATRQLLRALPATRVIILTGYGDEASLRNAADAGATGYLLKEDSAREVCRAVREVHRQGIFFSDSLSRRVVGSLTRGDRAGKGGDSPVPLSPREREVLQLIAEGRANKETAAELGISIKTVEKHRGRLMAKLGIHDTAGLTRHAVATGVIRCTVRNTFL